MEYNIKNFSLQELEELLNEVQDRIFHLKSQPIDEREELLLASKIQKLINIEADRYMAENKRRLDYSLDEWKWELYRKNLLTESEYEKSIGQWNGIVEIVLP